jgi:hypothetical protein
MAENAIVALLAAELYFETIAGGITPGPWEDILGDQVTPLYDAVYGSMFLLGGLDFTPQHDELHARATAKVRTFFEALAPAYAPPTAVGRHRTCSSSHSFVRRPPRHRRRHSR